MTGTHYNHKKILQLRKVKGLTQTDAANAIKLTLRQYQRIEAGESASMNALAAIAGLHKIPTTDLLYASPQKFLPSKTTSRLTITT